MFKKILYPIDLEESECALGPLVQVVDHVVANEAELYLIYVLPSLSNPLVASYFPANAREELTAKAKASMESFIDDNIPNAIRVTSVVTEGTPYEEILREAHELKVDLIMISSHNREGLERWLLGSTTAKVVRHAHCSVMVLRAR